jgi:hypothetical protein
LERGEHSRIPISHPQLGHDEMLTIFLASPYALSHLAQTLMTYSNSKYAAVFTLIASVVTLGKLW